MTFDRRTLLKSSAAAVGALACRDAFAQGEPLKTYVIELCLRDQLDFGHVMVAPSLARDSNLIRGPTGRRAALFFQQAQLIEAMPNVFLTPQSAVLRPHLDTIAMMELGELTYGPVHGHEAGNPLRSPGRSLQSGNGRLAMWNGEPGQSNGEGVTYSRTPTLVALHNAWQKQQHPGTRNGVVIKGTQRSNAIYHFGAGVVGAEPDRFQTVAALLRAFPDSTQQRSIISSPAEADAIRSGLLARDRRVLQRRAIDPSNHETQVQEARNLIYRPPSVFSLALTPQERAAWSAGVPARYGRTTIDVWEQAAYAFKLVANDVVRSVALEVDIGDIHGERTEAQMRDQTAIVVLPLLRLIENLKAANLYDRTLIVISTADGGRSPASGSSGDEGKNGVILAGGMIRGGYYGDIQNAGRDGDGHRYRYHMPDLATGAPIADGTTGNDRRVPAAPLYRTMAKALSMPDSLLGQFTDVAQARPLPWMLRSP
ncbi:MAG: DUF1501 domain-containing protein [Myxococcaceae bacterium]|jgi:hypothetical protein|nr:DUF1501 domain-containing protein [Myxococcaceae bacterium]